jgi:hypothetical protein
VDRDGDMEASIQFALVDHARAAVAALRGKGVFGEGVRMWIGEEEEAGRPVDSWSREWTFHGGSGAAMPLRPPPPPPPPPQGTPEAQCWNAAPLIGQVGVPTPMSSAPPGFTRSSNGKVPVSLAAAVLQGPQQAPCQEQANGTALRGGLREDGRPKRGARNGQSGTVVPEAPHAPVTSSGAATDENESETASRQGKRSVLTAAVAAVAQQQQQPPRQVPEQQQRRGRRQGRRAGSREHGRALENIPQTEAAPDKTEPLETPSAA